MNETTPQPNSKSGRMVGYIAAQRRPVSTREIADKFGVASTVASALLNQLRNRGNLRQVRRGTIGCKGTPATWATVESKSNKQPV